MEQICALASSMGIGIYWDVNVIDFKFKVLFEKHGFVTRISVPIDAIKAGEWDDFWVSKMKEANELLDVCQQQIEEQTQT